MKNLIALSLVSVSFVSCKNASNDTSASKPKNELKSVNLSFKHSVNGDESSEKELKAFSIEGSVTCETDKNVSRKVALSPKNTKIEVYANENCEILFSKFMIGTLEFIQKDASKGFKITRNNEFVGSEQIIENKLDALDFRKVTAKNFAITIEKSIYALKYENDETIDTIATTSIDLLEDVKIISNTSNVKNLGDISLIAYRNIHVNGQTHKETIKYVKNEMAIRVEIKDANLKENAAFVAFSENGTKYPIYKADNLTKNLIKLDKNATDLFIFNSSNVLLNKTAIYDENIKDFADALKQIPNDDIAKSIDSKRVEELLAVSDAKNKPKFQLLLKALKELEAEKETKPVN